jgi:hypothetical protein
MNKTVILTHQGSEIPGRVINLDQARVRHGDKADHMVRMLAVGDPLADAVIVEMDALGEEGRRILNAGLADGLESLTERPPAITALLRTRACRGPPTQAWSPTAALRRVKLFFGLFHSPLDLSVNPRPYEQGRIRHVGAFPKLEDQLCLFTPDMQREDGASPDRGDALGRTLALMREGWGRMHPQLWFDAGDGPGPVIAEAGARPRDRAACARRLAAYRKRPPVAPHRSGFLRLAFRSEPVR